MHGQGEYTWPDGKVYTGNKWNKIGWFYRCFYLIHKSMYLKFSLNKRFKLKVDGRMEKCTEKEKLKQTEKPLKGIGKME